MATIRYSFIDTPRTPFVQINHFYWAHPLIEFSDVYVARTRPGAEKAGEKKAVKFCLNANNKYNKNSIVFYGLFLDFRSNPDSRFTTVPIFNMLYQNEIKPGSVGYGYNAQGTGVECEKAGRKNKGNINHRFR
jgi:hypothetical protein